MKDPQRALGWLAAIGLAAGLVVAFGIAPREATTRFTWSAGG